MSYILLTRLCLLIVSETLSQEANKNVNIDSYVVHNNEAFEST